MRTESLGALAGAAFSLLACGEAPCRWHVPCEDASCAAPELTRFGIFVADDTPECVGAILRSGLAPGDLLSADQAECLATALQTDAFRRQCFRVGHVTPPGAAGVRQVGFDQVDDGWKVQFGGFNVSGDDDGDVIVNGAFYVHDWTRPERSRAARSAFLSERGWSTADGQFIVDAGAAAHRFTRLVEDGQGQICEIYDYPSGQRVDYDPCGGSDDCTPYLCL